MLPSKKRLNLKKDFKWVASGKKVESPLITLFIKRGENLFPRIGIANSSKVFKEATKRNRARRITSKGFEEIYNLLPKDINIVALPKQGLIDVKSQDVTLDLRRLLDQYI